MKKQKIREPLYRGLGTSHRYRGFNEGYGYEEDEQEQKPEAVIIEEKKSKVTNVTFDNKEIEEGINDTLKKAELFLERANNEDYI